MLRRILPFLFLSACVTTPEAPQPAEVTATPTAASPLRTQLCRMTNLEEKPLFDLALLAQDDMEAFLFKDAKQGKTVGYALDSAGTVVGVVEEKPVVREALVDEMRDLALRHLQWWREKGGGEAAWIQTRLDDQPANDAAALQRAFPAQIVFEGSAAAPRGNINVAIKATLALEDGLVHVGAPTAPLPAIRMPLPKMLKVDDTAVKLDAVEWWEKDLAPRTARWRFREGRKNKGFILACARPQETAETPAAWVKLRSEAKEASGSAGLRMEAAQAVASSLASAYFREVARPGTPVATLERGLENAFELVCAPNLLGDRKVALKAVEATLTGDVKAAVEDPGKLPLGLVTRARVARCGEDS